MKKLVLLAFLSTLLFSCSKVKEGEFIIEGEAKGIANGKEVTLLMQDDSLGMVPVDTVKVENEKFVFKGKTAEPKMHVIQIKNDKPLSLYTIVESGAIEVEIDKDSLQKSKVGGTFNNDEMQSFTDKRNELQKKIKDYEKVNQSKLDNAQKNNDEKTINQLKSEYKALQDDMKNYVVKYVEEHPKSYISLLIIYAMFNEMQPDLPKIEKYYNGLDATLKNHSEGKKILKTIKKLKSVDVGIKAPDFSAKSPEGKVVSLNESLGKVTIIDFWASWCKPCRMENPNVVALYNELHSKGLNIVGVSLDKDLNKWKEAIAKDGITWTQVSNLKEWSEPIALLYNVNSIPKTFILNKYGVVVAKDLTGKELKDKVTELLAEN